MKKGNIQRIFNLKEYNLADGLTVVSCEKYKKVVEK